MNDITNKPSHVDCPWHEEYLENMSKTVIVVSTNNMSPRIIQAIESIKWSVGVDIMEDVILPPHTLDSSLDLLPLWYGMSPMQPATLNSAKITAALIIMSDSFQSQFVHRDTMILENIRREPFEFPVWIADGAKKNQPYYRQKIGKKWNPNNTW